MNTQTQEALKMAIEALKKLARLGNGDSYGNSDGNCIAISALKAIDEALAQPAQEPVAWMSKMGSFTAIAETKKQLPKGSEPIALYTHPHQWQGLTDDEQHEIVQDSDWDNPYGIADAIEQALRIKNDY